jgi:hypothetical protein
MFVLQPASINYFADVDLCRLSNTSLLHCIEWQIWAYSVEKLENRGLEYFRCRSKISKAAVKFTHPDSQALQGDGNRKFATLSAKITKTISMRQEFLDQRQIGSFSTVSAGSSLSLLIKRTAALRDEVAVQCLMPCVPNRGCGFDTRSDIFIQLGMPPRALKSLKCSGTNSIEFPNQ